MVIAVIRGGRWWETSITRPTYRSCARPLLPNDVAISPSAAALVVVAAIVVVQFALLLAFVVSQHDRAHLVDISGKQRMRSQRIAYLTTIARDGAEPARWRDELDRTLDDLVATRDEIRRSTGAHSGAVEIAATSDLENMTDRYVSAARAIARDPRDRLASATVAALRLPLLSRFDLAVQRCARRSGSQRVALAIAILASALALIASIALVWARIVLPNERRGRVAHARLVASQQQLRSLVYEHPGAVAVYDRDGLVVRGNRVGYRLLGAAGRAGRHFTTHVAHGEREPAERAFARALAGDKVSFETRILHANGREIDVAVELFPNVVDGEIAGAIGVAKDISELVRARRAMREQAERIDELYLIAAGRGRSWQEQIDDALAFAMRRLGYAWGTATELVDGRVFPIAVAGIAPPVALGVGTDLEHALARFVIRGRDIWEVTDVARSVIKHDTATIVPSLGSVVALPLEVDGKIFGTFGFGDALPRAQPLDEAGRTFLRLVAASMSSALERGRHQRKLDALAFSDALTGLANRVLRTERLAEYAAASRRPENAFAVHYVDVDRFKSINDTYGHGAGDEILRAVAHRMQSCVRATDVVARLGGDEFVIVQRGADDRDGAHEFASRVIAAVGLPCVVDGVAHDVSVSVGIALFPHDGGDGPALLARADEALYRAKNEGRNCLEFSAA